MAKQSLKALKKERDIYRGRSLVLAALLKRATGDSYEWADARMLEAESILDALSNLTREGTFQINDHRLKLS